MNSFAITSISYNHYTNIYSLINIYKYIFTYTHLYIGFAAYLVFLHVWVFFVLAMHTHNLEGIGIQEPSDFVNNKVNKG